MDKVQILALLLKDELKEKGYNYLVNKETRTLFSMEEYLEWEVIPKPEDSSGIDPLFDLNSYSAFTILNEIVLGNHSLNGSKYGVEFGNDYSKVFLNQKN